MSRRLLPLVLLLAGCVATPESDYRAGRVREAEAAFRRRVESGDSSAVAAYNLGTARLRLGEYPAARGGLESAARSRDPEVRFRADFNAGLADLEPALAAAERDSATLQRLRRAISRYRAALRLRTGDRDAKWNLELAERAMIERPAEDPSGGGQDQQDPSGGGTQQGTAESSAGPGNPGLTKEEADRILSAADREDRRVQHRRMETAPAAERAARDW